MLGFPTAGDLSPGDSSPLLWKLELVWKCASQLPTAAIGAFQDAGSGLASSSVVCSLICQ